MGISKWRDDLLALHGVPPRWSTLHLPRVSHLIPSENIGMNPHMDVMEKEEENCWIHRFKKDPYYV